MRKTALTLATLALLLGGPAYSQTAQTHPTQVQSVKSDPVADITNPVAAIAPISGDPVPTSGVFLDGSGATSIFPLDWSVKAVTPNGKQTAFVLSFDKGKRTQIYAQVVNLSPGITYVVSQTALGRDAAGNPISSTDSIVFSTSAIPNPVPVVDPAPVMPPVLPPVVVPATEKIYVTIAYPFGDPTGSAMLQSSVVSSLVALNASGHVFNDSTAYSGHSQTILQEANLAPYYHNRPIMFIQRQDGTILTGPDGKTTDGYGIRPMPPTADSVTSIVKKLRGL